MATWRRAARLMRTSGGGSLAPPRLRRSPLGPWAPAAAAGQRRGLRGSMPARHGGGSANRFTDSLTDEDKREQERITWVGLISNVGLSAAKGLIGWQSGSVSLIADAFHSASDLCGDFVALAALSLARRPADEMHPYGYGHYESLATLAVAALLVGGGAGIGYNSVEQLFAIAESDIEPLKHVPAAVGIIGVSVGIKEWLYRRTVDVGKRTRSPVLVANAWHHRTDAFSSVVALIGIGGAACGMHYLDPVAGLLVSGMVLKAGADVGWDAVQDLTDRKRDSDETLVRGVYRIARHLAQQHTSGIIDAHEVRVRRLGHYVLLDFHLRVDPRLSVTGGYLEKNRMKRRVYEAFPAVGEMFIHVQAHPSRTQTFTSDNFDKLPADLNRGDPPEMQLGGTSRGTMRSARSQFAIEQDVAQVVKACRLEDPVILGLSHTLVHYNITSDENEPCVNLEVNLRMAKHITLQRAEEAAHTVRERLGDIDDVDTVDIHLELLDS